MVFKVYYQPTKKINPRRENSESLYLWYPISRRDHRRRCRHQIP